MERWGAEREGDGGQGRERDGVVDKSHIAREMERDRDGERARETERARGREKKTSVLRTLCFHHLCQRATPLVD